jgi:hypothetical protein
MRCDDLLEALSDCQGKHPKEKKVLRLGGCGPNCLGFLKCGLLLDDMRSSGDFRLFARVVVQHVCRHLEKQAAWCLLSVICPKECEAVEACSHDNRLAKRRPGPPSNIPKHCQSAMATLDACIQAHQGFEAA